MITAQEFNKQGALSAMQAQFEAGAAMAQLQHRKREELATLAGLEAKLQRYAPHDGERPLAHLDRLRADLLSRNGGSIGAYAAELAELSQFALAATGAWRARATAAEKTRAVMEADYQEQTKESRRDAAEIDALEARAVAAEVAHAAARGENGTLRRAFGVACVVLVWLPLLPTVCAAGA